ncbi:MAG TPA: sugar phosphate isomerase/epimerase family protein [Tepidisphaeraceae bacterium]|nr:sugar phosphate isomerase/epimerase family protein [Tepidisphaeraceae bacterium]
MQLGFVSAILPDLKLEEVLQFAEETGFETVELMCWPAGGADRRYAGVTHLDAAAFGAGDVERVHRMLRQHNVSISSLGYYPNPLCRDKAESDLYIAHIKKVIDASAALGVGLMTTFIGRDPQKSIDDNWAAFDERWPGIVAHAETRKVKIAIENCPMLFSANEWPGGKNMAVSPKVWREMFRRIPSPNFGLNFDPSHFILQFMDPARCIAEFAGRIFHVHAKDLRIHRDKLDERGIFDFGWNEPKLPGLGDVDWGAMFAALTDARYHGPVCIEVEDRAFEGSLHDRKRSLVQSKRFLENYVV